MTDKKSITRNPRELFKEIDAMCEEINAVVSDIENKIKKYPQYKGCSMSKKKKNEQSERINIRNFYLHS